MKKILNITSGTSAMNLNNTEVPIKYNLSIGEPAGKPLDNFQVRFFGLLNSWYNHYSPINGLEKLRKQLNPTDPDKVLIGNGSKGLIYTALLATCEKGDNVLIIGPCWPSYMEMCKILGLQIVQYIPEGEGWHCNINEIEKYIKTFDFSLVIFCNPNNPTGEVSNWDFIHKLCKLCKEYNCWLLADEAYEDFVYNIAFYSCWPATNDNIICVKTFSKCAAIAGWRLGYCLGPAELIKQMSLIQSQISGPPSTLVQNFAVSALKHKVDSKDSIVVRNDYLKIRNYLCSINPLFQKYKPQGGFYFYIPVKDSKATFDTLLEHGILVTPGDEYGVPNTIRLSFANITLKELKEIEPYLVAVS